MNEKLSQKPRNQRPRKNGSLALSRDVNPVPEDPSKYYIVDDETRFLGVYSSTAAANRAAKLVRARKDYPARRAHDEFHNCGNKVRVLPQKLIGITRSRNDSEKDSVGDGHTLSPPTKEDPDQQDSKTIDAPANKPDRRRKKTTPDTLPSSADGVSGKPTPFATSPVPSSEKPVQSVHVALDNSLCLGLFTEKPAAWEACMKHKTQMTYSVDLMHAKKWVDKSGMPYLEGMISGSGRHCWHVKVCVVDEMPHGRQRGT
jgi:hypothetical protein